MNVRSSLFSAESINVRKRPKPLQQYVRTAFKHPAALREGYPLYNQRNDVQLKAKRARRIKFEINEWRCICMKSF